MMKRILLFFTFLTLSVAALAQRVSFDAAAPLTVVAGDRFRVEFVLQNGEGENFIEPKFDGVTVLAGPTISTGTQIYWDNGVQDSFTSMTYTYFIEASTTTTKATISPASVTAGGKVYKTRSLSINIVQAGSSQSSAAQQGGAPGASGSQQPNQARQSGKIASDDIMLRMELSKKECFKGEAVSAQLKLYTRVAIGGVSDLKYSAFNGFWTQEIEMPTSASAGVRATINGKVYESYTLRQWLIYPQKSGVLEVEQTSLKAMAQVVTQSSASSLFDQFFGGGASVSTVEKLLSTGVIRLNVKPLPTAGAPVGLPSAVGKFAMTAKLSSDQIAANSAGSLTVTLSGTGDFPLLEAPAFRLPAEFEQYDTKTTDNLKSTLAGTSGSRTWEFPFVARSEGSYTLPPVEIAYFDPSTKSYKTLTTDQYTIQVTRDAGGGSGGAVVSGVAKEDLKMLGQDIRYIKTTPFRSRAGGAWLYSATFFVAIIGLMAMFAALLFVFRRQMVRRADVVGSKNRKASKVALRRLKAAKRSMDAADRRAFLEEMLRALWGFVGDKFNVEVSELTKVRIEAEFASRATPEQQSREFLELVADCEMAQYAPSSSIDMQSIYLRALSLFDAL